MKKNTKIAALVTATIISSMACATFSSAEENTKVKCYGIAKAGKNDCKTMKHSCAGKAMHDNEGDEFMLVADKETCEHEKGMLTPKE